MRVLFITLTNIGDVVLSTTLLDRVLATHPDAVVDVVAGARAVELFKGMPNLGKLIPVIKKKRHGHYIDLWRELKGTNYDIIIDLRTPLLTKFLKGKKKITFRGSKKGHMSQQFADLWPQEETRTLQQRLWLEDETHNKVIVETAAFPGKLISVAPTANWIGKCWPQREFAETLRRISELDGMKGVTFAIFGAPHERAMVADLIDYLPKNQVVDLVGKTSLQQAFAWFKQSDLFLGNDSGLAHMAAAADIPMVTLFGPTSPERYAPLTAKGVTLVAPESEEVNLEPTVAKRLITSIKPDLVIETVVQVLERNAPQQQEKKHA